MCSQLRCHFNVLKVNCTHLSSCCRYKKVNTWWLRPVTWTGTIYFPLFWDAFFPLFLLCLEQGSHLHSTWEFHSCLWAGNEQILLDNGPLRNPASEHEQCALSWFPDLRRMWDCWDSDTQSSEDIQVNTILLIQIRMRVLHEGRLMQHQGYRLLTHQTLSPFLLSPRGLG